MNVLLINGSHKFDWTGGWRCTAATVRQDAESKLDCWLK
jgi:hypothetical protein